jgi:predicted Fe-Mo cluster-binding NifX family protein
MKIALPAYRGRIAPVFDTCQRLLVFQMDHGDVATPLESQDWSYLTPPVRANRLRQIGTDVLLCGGISGWLARQIEGVGIRLIPWLAGDIQEVLTAFSDGRLPNRLLAMPGAWSRGHGHRFRGRGGP